MTNEEKIRELKFVIGRYDQYFQGVNSKGGLYLTINTFILGSGVAGYFGLDKMYHFNEGFFALFILTLCANLGSVILTLLAIIPYLTTIKDNPDGSLIFFGDVCKYPIKQYENLWRDLNQDNWYIDLKKQCHLLSTGLCRKFKLLYYATWCIGAQVLLIIIFGIALIKK